MGKIIVNRVKSMSGRAKIGALIVFTLIFTTAFIVHNWHGPEIDLAEAAANDVYLFWDSGNGAVPAGWTNVSDTGQDFYQRFIRGSNTYSAAAGGTATHTHTAAINVTTYAADMDKGNTNSNKFNAAHSHTGSLSGLSGSNLPTFRNLVVMKRNAPATIPQYAIAMFNSEPLPAGWTEYSAQNGNFIYGAASAGGTGGGSHDHTVGFSLDNFTNINQKSSTVSSVSLIHSHTVSDQTTNAVNYQPLYREIILASKDSAGSIPDGMVAMFDTDPSGANWTMISNSIDVTDYYQRFLLPTSLASFTAPGGTGGGSGHAHNNTTPAASSAADTTGTRGNGAGSAGTSGGHTHDVNATTFNTIAEAGNNPPYVDVILAKYTATAAPPVIVNDTDVFNVEYSTTHVDTPFHLNTEWNYNDYEITSCNYSINGGGGWSSATISNGSTANADCDADPTCSDGVALSIIMNVVSSEGVAQSSTLSRDCDAADPSTIDDNTDAWSASDYNVYLTATETGSGIKDYYWCFNTVDGCSPSVQISNTIAINTCTDTNECTYYIEYQTEDNVLNMESVTSATYTAKVDKKAPTTGSTFTATPGNAQCSLSWDGATDDGSGLHSSERYEIRVLENSDPLNCSGGAQQYIGTGFSDTDSGLNNGSTYYYRLCYKDNVGNQSEYSGNAVTCDPVAAATPIIVNDTDVYNVEYSTTHVDSPFHLNTEWNYNSNEITSCNYSINGGGGWSSATISNGSTANADCDADPTCSDGASLSIIMNAVNSEGVSQSSTLSRDCDTAAPSTSDDAPAAWQSADFTVTLTSGDGGGSDVAKYYWCQNTSPGCTPLNKAGDNTIDITCAPGNECTSYIRYYAEDNVGNKETEQAAAQTAKIDDKAPTITSFTATVAAADQCNLNWAATENGVGMTSGYKITYNVNDAPPADCTVGTVLLDWSASTNTNVSGLTEDYKYDYRLCAKDILDNESSTTATCTPTGVAACDKTIDNTCTECHAIPPPDGPGGTRVFANGAVAGDHNSVSAHVPVSPTTSDCVACHGAGVTSYDQNHRDNVIDMAADINGGSYGKGASFAQDGSATGTCSATYCHGKSNESPTWGSESTSCSTCHTSQGAGGAEAYTLKHQKHSDVDNTAGYSYSCDMCHTSAGAVPVGHGNGNATASRAGEVVFSNTNSGTSMSNGTHYTSTTNFRTRSITNNPHMGEAVSTASYTEGSTGGSDSGFVYTTDGTCSAVWCHSNANPAGKANTYASPTFTDSMTCSSCHGSGSVNKASVALSDKHDTHVGEDSYDIRCVECHRETMSTTDSILALTGVQDWHVNGEKNLWFYGNFKDLGTINQTGGTITNSGSTTVCSNLYCHSDGTDPSTYSPVFTENWTNGSTGCSSCHDDAGTSTTLSGKHLVHTKTDTYSLSCNECHRLTVAGNTALNGTSGYTYHVNGIKNIGFAANARGMGIDQSGDTWSGTNCDGLYCHSNGQDDGTSSYTSVNVNWGDSGCGASICHANPPATPSASGAHATHATTYSYDCATCHDGGGQGNYSEHVNYSLKMAINSTLGASATYTQGDHTPGVGGGYGRCSNTYCHGVESPLFNTNFTGDTCTRCHGENTGGATMAQWAPGGSGVDTAGQTAATDANVGAHQAHLLSPNNISVDIECAECHDVPTTVGDSGHIDDALPGDITFNATGLGTDFGNLTPSYSGGACSGIYCHNTDFSSSEYGGGSGIVPDWSNATYLDGAMDATDCGRCHGYPPPSAHPTNGDCNGCHKDTVAVNNLTIIVANHIDGQVQGGGCDGCHKGRTGVGGETLAGRHASHYDSTVVANETSGLPGNLSTASNYIYNCGTCHDVEPTAGADHDDANNASTRSWGGGGSVVDIIANISLAPAGQKINGVYNSGSVTNSGDSSINYYINGSCSAFYCHSNANPAGGTNNYATPAWHGNDTTCTSCHSGQEAVASYGATDISLAHDIHTASDRYNLTCDECHASVVADNSRTSVTDRSLHVNGSKNLQFSTTSLPATIDHSAGTTASSGSSRTCSNIYCHSIGTLTASRSDNTITWGATATCTSCHDDAGATTTLSGKHEIHIDTDTYNFSCDECHRETVAGLNTINGTGYAYHVNGSKNILMTTNMRGSAIDHSSGGFNPSPTWTCTNLYCHSDVQTGTAGSYTSVTNTPDWDSDSTSCTYCHGDPPGTPAASGAHVTHATTYSYDCATCHDGGGGTGDYAKHVDGFIDIVINSTVSTSGTYTGGAQDAPGDSSYGKCSNTYCHGVESPEFDTNFTGDTCTRCHGENTGGATMAQWAPGGSGVDTGGQTSAADANVGAHQVHLTSDMDMSADIECAECHDVPTAVGDSGHIDDALPGDITFNATGIGTNFGNLTPSYNTSTGTCSGVYCHNTDFSRTEFGGGNNLQPEWDETTYLDGTVSSSADCDNCHGYPPDPDHPVDSACGGCHAETVDSGDDLTIFVDGTGFSNHIDGSVTGGGDCTGCHTNATGTVRAIMPDFTRGSKHVSDGTTTSRVTIWDCVLCHLEGNRTTGEKEGASLHNNNLQSGLYQVDLRNVDSRDAGWAWNRNIDDTTMRDNMDTFCMACHDALGATDISVNNTWPDADGMLFGDTSTVRKDSGGSNLAGNPTVNLRPFNVYDTLQNVNDTSYQGDTDAITIGVFRTNYSTGYGRVLNVKDQFNVGDSVGSASQASHHNLNQWAKRYGTQTLNTAVWTAYTTKEGVTLNSGSATAGEEAGLHCSDCHLNEVNAHGSANSWYMLTGKNISSDDDVAPTLNTVAETASTAHETNCFRCHSSAIYAVDGGGNQALSRYDHSSSCTSRVGSAGATPSLAFPFSIRCTACHGGWSEYTGGSGNNPEALGSIHGNNDDYYPNNGGTSSKRYRFMSGATMRFYTPNDDAADYTGTANWTSGGTSMVGGGCYTVGEGTNTTWGGGCTKHPGGVEADDKNFTRGLDY